MKKLLAITFAAAAFTAFAGADGYAQTTTPADRPATRDTDRKSDKSTDKRPVFKSDQDLHESRQLIGARVRNSEGKDVGTIDQLLIDPKDGKITHAVIGLGGLAGIGKQDVVVKWSDIQMSTDTSNKKPALVVSQATLDNAPRYERSVAGVDRDKSPSASPSTAPSNKPTSSEKK